MINIPREVAYSTRNARQVSVVASDDDANRRPNVLMPGFTLGTRYGVYHVIDPYGMTVKLSNVNAMAIIEQTHLSCGLIQDRCIWAVTGSGRICSLLPEFSTAYKQALIDTAAIQVAATAPPMKVGDTVTTLHGLTGEYMGVLSLYGPCVIANGGKLSGQTMLRKHVLRVAPGKYYYKSSLRQIGVVPATKPNTRSQADIASELNAEIQQGGTYFSNSHTMLIGGAPSYYCGYGKVTHVSAKARPVTLKLEPIDRVEADVIFHIAHAESDSGRLLMCTDDGPKCVANFNTYATNALKFTIRTVNTNNFTTSRVHITHSLDDFNNFFRIDKYVGTEFYC